MHDFQYADAPEPHRERTKAILKAHPETRELIGRNPRAGVPIRRAI
jgi:sphingolipid delta-4 desaturase